MTTTDRIIPGLRGFDDEGFPFWEPEELDGAREAFLDDVKATLGYHTSCAFEDALHTLTSKADPYNDGTRFREAFVTLLVRLADRETRRAEILTPRPRPTD